MTRLPKVSGEQAIRALERLGFVQVRQRGRHVIMKRQTDEGTVGCVVPLHKEIAIGTLHAVLQQAGVTPEDFLKNL